MEKCFGLAHTLAACRVTPVHWGTEQRILELVGLSVLRIRTLSPERAVPRNAG